MRFHFSISGLGTFLGKSPVTLRSWERKGLVSLPRVGNSRSLTTSDVTKVALIAYRAGRISQERLLAIQEATGCLDQLEDV